ncbi:PrsW family intramembrane metalloprotease [Streptomyces sp. CBG9]|uniref:PrsW family intramembrane metalloprotease n=1 Tax=Streptomyces sp. CBG9 TaxID=2762622 RepID=UPI0016492A11|nr:PrsW family intramembrane metalloprotease [Streptomyces sp. CBG9]
MINSPSYSASQPEQPHGAGAEGAGPGQALPPPPPMPPYPAALPRMRWWQRHAVRVGLLVGLLTVSGGIILALVREQTGTHGFLVGLGLALLPVPLLLAVFRWVEAVEPGPWRNLIFCFAWGACAAALIAIVANTLATEWLVGSTLEPFAGGDEPLKPDAVGATFVAPVVEESAKAVSVLLIFLFRRQHFRGLLDGAVTAGLTGAGFAFTENILYLGNAFGRDQLAGDSGMASVTAATFFVRIVLSPFAHPLFTLLTGIGFGLAARTPGRRRVRRVLLPLAGLLLSMGMHGLWNGSATLMGPFGFITVYAVVMVPVFGLSVWLLVWARADVLRAVRTHLPAYVAAGWLAPAEPAALATMNARHLARDHARRSGGRKAVRALAAYQRDATTLAVLRRRGERGQAEPDFVDRERALLNSLWERRETIRPAQLHAARLLAPPPPAMWLPPQQGGWGWGAPYGNQGWGGAPWGGPWPGPASGPGPAPAPGGPPVPGPSPYAPPPHIPPRQP